MAPEVIKRKHYGVAADIFSFGVVCCELLLGRYPYEKSTQSVNQSVNHVRQRSTTGAFENALIAGLRPIIVSYCPKLIKEMIEACLSEDPSKRPTMEQIFNVLVQAEQQLSANESHSMFDDCPPAILEVIRAQRHDLDVLEASAKNNATLLTEAEKRIHELEAAVEAERRAREKAEMTASLLQQALSSNHTAKPGNSPTALGMVRSNSAMPAALQSPSQSTHGLLREMSSNSDSTGISPSRRSSISNPPLCVSPPAGQPNITSVTSTPSFSSPRQSVKQSVHNSTRSSLNHSSSMSPRADINSSPVPVPVSSPLLASVSAPGGASGSCVRMSSQSPPCLSPRSPLFANPVMPVPGC